MAERSAAPGGARGSRGALPWRVGDSVRTERSVCGCDPVWEGPETQGKGAGSGDRRLRLDTRGEALDARCQGLLGRSWAESSPSWARLRRGSPPLTEAARPDAPYPQSSLNAEATVNRAARIAGKRPPTRPTSRAR